MNNSDLLTIFFIILGSLMYTIGKIWAIVSFILYLTKDTLFDWTSIIVLGSGILITVVVYLIFIKNNL